MSNTIKMLLLSNLILALIWAPFCQGYSIYKLDSQTKLANDEAAYSLSAIIYVDVENLPSGQSGLLKIQSCTIDAKVCEDVGSEVFVRWRGGIVESVSSNQSPIISAFLILFETNEIDQQQNTVMSNGLKIHYHQGKVNLVRTVEGTIQVPIGGQILAAPPTVKYSDSSEIHHKRGSDRTIESIISNSRVSILSPVSPQNPISLTISSKIALHEKNNEILQSSNSDHDSIPFHWSPVIINGDSRTQISVSSKVVESDLITNTNKILSDLHELRAADDQKTIKEILTKGKDEGLNIVKLAVCGTFHCHNAAMDFCGSNVLALTNYISQLANSPLDDQITNDLMVLYSKKVSLQVTIWLVLTTRVRRHCQNVPKCALLNEYIGSTERQLRTCGKIGKEPSDLISCQAGVFDAISNLKSKDALEFPTRFVCTKNGNHPRMQFAVLQALQASLGDENIWNQEVENILISVFSNRCPESYDQISRSLSGQILLDSGPKLTAPEHVLDILFGYFRNESKDGEKETSQLLWNSLIGKSQNCDWYRDQMGKLITRLHGRFNYNTLSLGHSSQFGARLSGSDDNSHVIYNLDMELLGGMLKRSTFTLDWMQNNHQFPVTSFEIFSSGIHEYLGGGEEEVKGSQDTEEPMASMRLGLMGSKENIVSLFQGSAELMSAVWAADGTSIEAYHGNILVHDASYSMALPSGINLNFDLTTLLSVRVKGSVEISLWFRNSKSIVSTSAALNMHISATLNNGKSLLSTTNQQTTSIGNVDFRTYVDFQDDPPKLCMVIDQNEGRLKSSMEGSSFSMVIPGKSYTTHPKISAMCSQFDELTQDQAI